MGGAGSFDVEVGERIWILMRRARLTQTEFARQIGIDQSVLSKKLHGRTRWYAREIAAAAAVLETSNAFLYGETDDPTPPLLGG